MIAESSVAAAADLSQCDREPIHIPGTIQPHGFLLAGDEGSQVVDHASENVAELLGRPVNSVLGATVAELLGSDLAAALRRAAENPLFAQRAVFLGRRELAPGTHEVLAHRRDGRVILEAERVETAAPAGSGSPQHQLESFLTQMVAAGSVSELARLAASEVRRITQFDRVLVYRFDDEAHGNVMAEDRNDVLPSYLGLRFPASDIPRQARELYRVNRLRLIGRADYQPVRIQARDRDAGPLDLSLSTLRSVSPVHLEYMRNMGTGSSMSISLLRGNQLWGLISCHSRGPWLVPFEARATCDLIGQVLSLQLAARESAAVLTYRTELRSLLSSLLAAMARHDSLAEGLMAGGEALLQLTGATGVAVMTAGGTLRLRGRTPREDQVEALAAWIESAQPGEVYATERLGEQYPPAREYAADASGLLAVSISQIHRHYILWFREELVATVKWGGDPTKPVTVSGEQLRLHPRRSFAAWVETVRGRSAPWQAAELDAARELRSAVIEVVLKNAERLAQVSEELARTNRELENFSYTVSHDLRAPFRHIRAYAELLRLDKGRQLDEEGRQFVEHLLSAASYAGRLVDNILYFSRMGRDELLRTEVDLNELAAEVVADMKAAAAGRAIEWKVGPLPTVEADAAMLRTVMSNLLENAVKYSRERQPARIEVSAEESPTEFIVAVRDNGVGFNPEYQRKLFGMFQRLHRWEEFEGTGIGLASVRRIIARHGGRVWAQGAPDQGATFFFALPREPDRSPHLYA